MPNRQSVAHRARYGSKTRTGVRTPFDICCAANMQVTALRRKPLTCGNATGQTVRKEPLTCANASKQAARAKTCPDLRLCRWGGHPGYPTPEARPATRLTNCMNFGTFTFHFWLILPKGAPKPLVAPHFSQMNSREG